MASFLSLLIYNLIKFAYLKIRLGFDPFSEDVLKISIIGIVTYSIQYYLLKNMEVRLTDTIVRSIVITLVFVFGIYFMGIAKESQKMVVQKIKGPRP